ncbi:glycosyltransferase family 39 protein [Candidatus Gottesmanbacteria bacterium]|nr:glycosyltransferase family 39 protein [Candidatus Gottesmanbacteria bacterium]
MGTFNKLTAKISLLWLLPLYLLPRLVFILRYPIFNDESTYVRYGQVTVRGGYIWYSLVMSGKQPLPYVLYGLFSLLMYDPLIAARFVSILCGLGVFTLLYYLLNKSINKESAIVGVILYAVSPFSVFYDSLALVETMISLCFMLILTLLYLYMNKKDVRVLILCSIVFGISLWIKSTSLLFSVLFIVYFLLTIKSEHFSLKYALTFFGIILGGAFFVVLPLVMRPEFARTLSMPSEYTFTLGELLSVPWQAWRTNIVNILLVVIGYLSPLVIGFVTMRKSDIKNTDMFIRLILISTVTLLCLISFLARYAQGRYLYFMIGPIVMSLVFLFHSRRMPVIISALVSGAFSLWLVIFPSSYFLHLPQTYAFASDTDQYVTGWASGYGVREAIEYIKNDAGDRRAFVAVRWDSGNPEDAALVYLNPPYAKLTTWYLDKRLKMSELILKQYEGKPFYLLTRKGQKGDFGDMFTLVRSFDKPGGKESVEVYKRISITNNQ